MTNKKIIPEDRRNKIIQLVNYKDTVSVAELVSIFKVSEITIRRDLELLKKRGVLDKIYGGISKKYDQISEVHYIHQLNKMVREKKHIAKECIKRIKNGSTILLHGGTTCLEIAKRMDTKDNLNIITCFPPIIEIIWNIATYKNKNFKIHCPGGQLQAFGNLFCGKHSQNFFKDISIDLSFIGVIALNPNDGFMVTTEEEASLLFSIVNSSKNIIAPMDHSKFEKNAFIKVGFLDKLDEIITDTGLNDKICKQYTDLNVKVTKV